MNELPLVLISKELKYMLSQQKIKTLEKALQYKDSINDEAKRKIIQSTGKRYDAIRDNVHKAFEKINNSQIKGEDSNSDEEMKKMKVEKIYQFLLKPSITEIYGAKGCGKTCLLLHFLEKFIEFQTLQKNGGTRVYMFNCASGLTQKRMSRLFQLIDEEQCKIEYYDSLLVEEITKTCTSLLEKQKDEKTISIEKNSILVIDSLVSLLLGQEKTKIIVCKLFKVLNQLYKKYGYTIMFTNLVQHKFEVGNEELYNHASYHSQYHNQFITNKIYVERPGKNGFRFQGVDLKRFNNDKFWFEIEEDGIQVVGTYGNYSNNND